MGLFDRFFSKDMALREPQFSGLLYPEDPEELRRRLEALLEKVEVSPSMGARGIVVPYSQYAYSGPVAASGWSQARSRERFLMLGPSQRVPFRGLAVPSVDGFDTPLGPVRVDTERRDALLEHDLVRVLDAAHDPEQSLEVQMPFAHHLAGEDARVLPLLVGDCDREDLARFLDVAWTGDDFLVVACELSSDEPHDIVEAFDTETAEIFERRAWDEITFGRVTARSLAQALLTVAEQRTLDVRALDVRTSHDTQDVEGLVAGYGAFVMETP